MSQPRWFVCSDIFGVTPELKALVDAVGGNDADVTYLSPVPSIFAEEDAAYAAFTGAGGIERYVRLVTETLSACHQPYLLLGFSAGGAAAWQAQCLTKDATCKQMIGFYPGQIRYFTDSDTNVRTTLIFARKESHFDIDPVIEALDKQTLVMVEKSDYNHGFMNPRSGGFDATGYATYRKRLRQLLES